MAAEKEKAPTSIHNLFGELLKRKGSNTPSEMLVNTARDRDLLYDMISHKKEELDNPEMDEETRKFTEDYVAALSEAKAILTSRIQYLLAKT